MVKIKDVEYDGTVKQKGDNLVVTLNTQIMYNDLLDRIADTKKVEHSDEDGNVTKYAVTRPISAWIIGRNTYEIRYGTKMSAIEMLEEKNRELSDAIDEILIMLLEG